MNTVLPRAHACLLRMKQYYTNEELQQLEMARTGFRWDETEYWKFIERATMDRAELLKDTPKPRYLIQAYEALNYRR